jgi:RND family efflux transporter MFP subunit
MNEMPDSSKVGRNSLWARWDVISVLIGIFIAGLVIGLLLRSGGGPVGTTSLTSSPASNILFWTCSMHPQIKQKGSGRCPICDMDLTPMREEAGGGEKASLRLGERARHLASVRTLPVIYRELEKSVYTVGKIAYDESRVANVTAWVSGRVDRLFVNFTGTIIKKGEHLVTMYSPDLLSTQKEYLLAYNGIEQLRNSDIPETLLSSRTLLENAKQRLLLWGITEEQIEELEKTQNPQVNSTIYAPIGGTVIHKNVFEGKYFKTGERLYTIADLSRVWLYLDIYEYDIPWIRYGQDIEGITESYPGETFQGKVVFIDPFLNETTRTVKVRINMDNHEGKLKPGMYINARLKAKLGGEGVIIDSELLGKFMCPMDPDILSDKEESCPVCEMTLELIGGGGRVGILSGIILSRYVCPMKCVGSASDEPGNCPRCKMVLVENEGDKIQGEDMLYVCSEHIDVQTGLPGKCPSCQRNLKKSNEKEIGVLAVPHSAVLFTGKRNIVYVEKEEGNYVPRDVVLGPKADEYYPVIEGLNVGEKVVIEGNFLIDSQMQLLGKPSLLFPEGSALEEPTAEKSEEQRDKGKHSTANIIDESILNLMNQVTGDILDNYYRIAARLANDSTEGVDGNLELIINNSKKIKDMESGIPENLLEMLSGITGNVEDGATEMKGVGLEEARKKFKNLSRSMITYLKELHGKINGAEKIYVYYCPMADASWLQKEEGTRNPYLGSSMLKCGTVKEELP